MTIGAPISGGIHLAPARFVTIDLAAALIGMAARAIRSKIGRGTWSEGREYVRRDGRVLLDLQAYKPPRSMQQRQEHAAAVKAFHRAKRRSLELCRTPAWADFKAMRSVYVEAQRLTRATGIQHHVDHEIPLQGRLVSGLHVHNNLQILTGSENSKKRNRFEIEL